MEKSEPEDQQVDKVIERIASALGVSTQEEWMARLQIAPETVRTWRKRGKVPAAQLLKVAELSGRSVESIARGGVFFPQKEKQLIRPPSHDLDLLMNVMTVVLESLEQQGLSLPPQKVSDLVRLIYEHESAHASTVAEKGIRQTADRYLRLVS
ncbi:MULTISPECIES: helix-turn-helix domain-containing protein [unclassified Variovorax]|uniref:helix-turn-helix domain-containing protein n=1 Tax=unclassified Variovorax TaxID=663243 RepID=UPI003F454674